MQNAPSLYSPILEQARLMQLIEAAEGEITEEVQDALALNEQNVVTRTASLLDMLDVAAANAEMGKQKEAQAANFRKANEKFIERVKQTLAVAVQQFGPISVDTRKVTLRKSEETVVHDADLIPDELLRPVTVPLRGAPDKEKIKARIKAGHTVPGASLQTNQKAQIK